MLLAPPVYSKSNPAVITPVLTLAVSGPHLPPQVHDYRSDLGAENFSRQRRWSAGRLPGAKPAVRVQVDATLPERSSLEDIRTTIVALTSTVPKET
ncbi:MAG: hypothetical protein U0787_08005 [Polyangia bacterium]